MNAAPVNAAPLNAAPLNTDRLLDLYDRIGEAPDAIPRLRRFVLDLAVRGKLVEQDPADEPASELLKRVGRLPPPPRYAKRSTELVPGECGLSINMPNLKVPATWRWVPLVNVARIESGHTPSRNRPDWWNGDVPWMGLVDARAHNNGRIYETIQHTNEAGLANSAARLLPAGTVCFSRTASVGYVVIMGRPMATSQDFVNWVPTEAISSEWLQLVMIAERPAIGRFSKGAVHQTIYYPAWLSMHVALPPLAEQHRIVAKVDELMALCDRLEEGRAKREALRDRLTAASLAQLTAPDADAETSNTHARFALQSLPALTTRPDQIKTLRQTILNLAVRGFFASGEMVKGRHARVGEFRSLQNGYAFKSGWFSKTGTLLLRNANVGHGMIHWEKAVYLPDERVSEFERFLLQEGDIVLTLDRPFIVTGTKVARVRVDDTPSLLLQRVGRFVETQNGLSDDYLFLWINSPHFSDQIDPGRSNGVPHISSKQVESAQIYVPSLAEQRRIVAKVDKLMALCDRLEASLAGANTTRRRLLEALLHEALEPAGEALEAAE